jgi:hypothetical protein
VGHFKGALKPDVATFRETFPWVYRILHQRQPQTIYLYCTGGIRCTRLGAYLKSKEHLLGLPISPKIYSVSNHDRIGKISFQNTTEEPRIDMMETFSIEEDSVFDSYTICPSSLYS